MTWLNGCSLDFRSVEIFRVRGNVREIVPRPTHAFVGTGSETESSYRQALFKVKTEKKGIDQYQTKTNTSSNPSYKKF